MELEIKQKNKGFTLIEVLTALIIFGLLIVGMTDIMMSSIKSQRKVFAIQQAQSNSRYALEFMTKEIRMSKINSSDGIFNTLDITNSDGEDIDYRFNSNELQRRVNGGSWQSLTSSDIKVDGKFNVQKGSSPNWAIVTIPISLEAESSNAVESSKIDVQLTVSSRLQ